MHVNWRLICQMTFKKTIELYMNNVCLPWWQWGLWLCFSAQGAGFWLRRIILLVDVRCSQLVHLHLCLRFRCGGKGLSEELWVAVILIIIEVILGVVITDHVSELGVVIILSECIWIILIVVVVVCVSLIFKDIFELLAFHLLYGEVSSSLSKLIFPLF